MTHRLRFVLVVILLLPLMVVLPPAQAQGPCGTVDGISTPLDNSAFFIAYPFGVPSSRFDGRYHAGEDWFGGRTATYGTPVRAIAKGRVTYSAPLGWGRDKGVVIIEHLLPDGTWWYSLYGHMEELDGHTFPAVYTCVDEGDIIGAVGRPRPAPHLHFEIRNFGSTAPGPGYWATDPIYSGWRDPSKFIRNWQGWLLPVHLWHADIADESGPHYPPIIRDDSATIVYDDGRLKAFNPSGQVLWRYVLSEDLDVVGVLPNEAGDVLVVDRGGLVQRWSRQGGFLDAWQLPTEGVSTAFRWQNLFIVYSRAEEALIAYGPDRTERWRVSDVPRPIRWQATDRMLGIIATQSTALIVGPDGRLLLQETIDRPGDLTPASGGALILRTGDTLWRVEPDGSRAELGEAPLTQTSSTAMYSLPDGRFFIYSGIQARTLYAYALDGSPLWASVLPQIEGDPVFYSPGNNGPLLVTTGYGQTVTLNVADGSQCGDFAIWGARRANAWAGQGPDGVLRLHIADQLIGLDWAALTAACSPS